MNQPVSAFLPSSLSTTTQVESEVAMNTSDIQNHDSNNQTQQDQQDLIFPDLDISTLPTNFLEEGSNSNVGNAQDCSYFNYATFYSSTHHISIFD
jgi:hypothetical protein